MTKYIQLKVGQVVEHVSNKYANQGYGDVISFSPSGFLVKWRASGQEVDYSPGTGMLRVIAHPVEPGPTKASLQPKSNALDNAQHTLTTTELVELRNQITGRTLKEVQAEQGPGYGAMSFSSRCSGKSTAQALSMVTNAILYPYTWHKSIPDHHGTTRANQELFRLFQTLVEKLGLKGFEFKVHDLQYRCVPIIKEVRRTTVETITSSYR